MSKILSAAGVVAADDNHRPLARPQGYSSLHPIMRIRQWLDRRLHERRKLNIDVVVFTNSGAINAVLRDVSSSGFGLDGVEGLNVGDRIMVADRHVLSLRGEVVWRSNGSAGARFLTLN